MMPFKKFTPVPKREQCKHPEHYPPSMVVLEPGSHDWECPGCGDVRRVVVAPRPELEVDPRVKGNN